MYISEVKVFHLAIPYAEAFHPTWAWRVGSAEKVHEMVLVQVATTSGIVGFGAAEANWGWGEVQTEIIKHMLKPRLLGENPFETERLIQRICDVPGQPWFVENALWDIIGKVCEQPLYKLWGGYRNKVKAYAAWGQLRTPEKAREDAKLLLDEGFKGIKIRLHNKKLKDDIELVKAVRDIVSDKMDIMVDANQANVEKRPGKSQVAWDYLRALKTARALEELDVVWLEEPLSMTDFNGLSKLHKNVNISIAGGEDNSIHELKSFIENDLYDVIQPNCTRGAGMLQIRKLAGLAEMYHKVCVPHAWVPGPGFMANLQIAAAIPNCTWIEYPYDPPALTPEIFHKVLGSTPQIDQDGYIHLPQQAGLGFEIDWDLVKQFGKDT